MILFTYGTLTFPEIVQALTGKRFRSEVATLSDHSARKLADWPFPGLVSSSGETTHGLILYDIDEASFEVIQAWEANGYRPEQVSVTANGKLVNALTYKWIGKTETDIWDKKYFQKHFLNDYIERIIPGFKDKLTRSTPL
jgi:gamma-glutamylcyclotransferase (GGCT)/AIG2-like uncharacterized protein YtfP